MTEQVPDIEFELALIAARIREVLTHAAISQTELARRLDMSSGYLSEIARGLKRPGTEFFLGIRRELGVSIDWLLTGDGAMFGGMGIRPELFQAIRLQIATARAAVIDKDPTAQELLQLIADGQLSLARQEPRFQALLERIAPDAADLDLAVALYNGHLWASDPTAQRRNLLASAIAHFQARPSSDKLGTLAGPQPTTQINIGKKQRVAGRNYRER